MSRVFFQWAVLAAILAGPPGQVGQAQTVAPPPQLACFEIEGLTPDQTARDLAGSLRQCVDEGRHGDAMALFVAFNSYALFDQQRVRDTTAHLVLDELNGWVFSGMWSDDMGVLKRYAEQFQDAGSAYHRRICSALWQVGPPSYRPTYMIVAGQMPRRDDADWQTERFDPETAWITAVHDTNGCALPAD